VTAAPYNQVLHLRHRKRNCATRSIVNSTCARCTAANRLEGGFTMYLSNLWFALLAAPWGLAAAALLHQLAMALLSLRGEPPSGEWVVTRASSTYCQGRWFQAKPASKGPPCSNNRRPCCPLFTAVSTPSQLAIPCAAGPPPLPTRDGAACRHSVNAAPQSCKASTA
jgi:hypothetical protein